MRFFGLETSMKKGDCFHESNEPTLSENDLKRIGILNKKVLKKDSEFRDATILVTTRKERDAINRTFE